MTITFLYFFFIYIKYSLYLLFVLLSFPNEVLRDQETEVEEVKDRGGAGYFFYFLTLKNYIDR